MPQDDPRTGKPEKYLSVNSVEVESLQVIGEFYRKNFQNGKGPVNLSALKVMEYNKACERGGVSVKFHHAQGGWTFVEDGRDVEAYQHRSNSISESHCGVEAIRSMSEDAAAKFARRLAGRPPGTNPHKF